MVDDKTTGQSEVVRKAMAMASNDSPLTIEELKERGCGWVNRKVTTDAYIWVNDQELNWLKHNTSFNVELWNVVISRQHRALGRQLTLVETQKAVEFLRDKHKRLNTEYTQQQAEYRKLVDRKLDNSIPAEFFSEENKVACDLCEERFASMMFNLVSQNRPITENGEAVQGGSFWLAPTGDNQINPIAVCPSCAKDLGAMRVGKPHAYRYGHPYGKAKALAEKATSDLQREATRQERLAELSNVPVPKPKSHFPQFGGKTAQEALDRETRALDEERKKGKR